LVNRLFQSAFIPLHQQAGEKLINRLPAYRFFLYTSKHKFSRAIHTALPGDILAQEDDFANNIRGDLSYHFIAFMTT
jgi:hypothetical protein